MRYVQVQTLVVAPIHSQIRQLVKCRFAMVLEQIAHPFACKEVDVSLMTLAPVHQTTLDIIVSCTIVTGCLFQIPTFVHLMVHVTVQIIAYAHKVSVAMNVTSGHALVRLPTVQYVVHMENVYLLILVHATMATLEQLAINLFVLVRQELRHVVVMVLV